MKFILKINGCKYDGFAMEIDNENKTYSIGYCQNSEYKKVKTTKRELLKTIQSLKNNGYHLLEKQWV